MDRSVLPDGSLKVRRDPRWPGYALWGGTISEPFQRRHVPVAL